MMDDSTVALGGDNDEANCYIGEEAEKKPHL